MSKTVYLGMIGDIMHPGLINIITEGARHGDVMIGLFTDKAIAMHRRLPYMTYGQRKNVVEHIRGVTSVVPQDEWSYVPNLRKYKPDYIIHGDDWKEGSEQELRAEVYEVMKELGGEVIEIPYTKGINSSSLDREIKAIGTTPDVRLKSLRRLIAAKPIVRIMEAHDGLSSLIIENTEVQKGLKTNSFDGMWSSSLTDSTSKGKPDIEAVDLTTRMQDLTSILECTTKPIIYDGDTGGKPEHFHHRRQGGAEKKLTVRHRGHPDTGHHRGILPQDTHGQGGTGNQGLHDNRPLRKPYCRQARGGRAGAHLCIR